MIAPESVRAIPAADIAMNGLALDHEAMQILWSWAFLSVLELEDAVTASQCEYLYLRSSRHGDQAVSTSTPATVARIAKARAQFRGVVGDRDFSIMSYAKACQICNNARLGRQR